jgi:hypothetical protein
LFDPGFADTGSTSLPSPATAGTKSPPLIDQVMRDFDEHPGSEDFMQRVARVIARHPEK